MNKGEFNNIFGQWRKEPWRKPDRTGGDFAIWYGPGGRRQAEAATEVRVEYNGYEVREYQHLGGYVDDYDRAEPFSVQSTLVTFAELVEALQAIGGKVSLAQVAASPDKYKRWAAGWGSAKISYYGGSESTVAELPY